MQTSKYVIVLGLNDKIFEGFYTTKMNAGISDLQRIVNLTP